MEKAADYKSLSKLVMAQIKPGVATNNFMEKSDYIAEIEKDSLFYSSREKGLFLFRRRDGFYRMNYYLRDLKKTAETAELSEIPELPEGVIITEQVQRPGEKAAEEGNIISKILEKLGFSLLFRRVRLERPEDGSSDTEELQASENSCIHDSDSAGEPASCTGAAADRPDSGELRICLAEPEDAEGVERLLKDCFDSRTGCLPRRDELLRDLEQGSVVCAKISKETEDAAYTEDDKNSRERIVGVIHFRPGRKNTEIRHLACAADVRGQGIAAKMFTLYMKTTEGQKSLVWVREDNAPAAEFYRYCGYRPDGWTSAVYQRESGITGCQSEK